MTEDPRAQRTLVKSPPELWAEVSDIGALARHLDGFGEIRITRLEPESTVAWEGDRVRGTVELEASGWGTRVTLTATPVASGRREEALEAELLAPEPPPEPPAGWWTRLRARLAGRSTVAAAPVPAPLEPVVPEPDPPSPQEAEAVLAGVLDRLGSAHHRPFSRG